MVCICKLKDPNVLQFDDVDHSVQAAHTVLVAGRHSKIKVPQ